MAVMARQMGITLSELKKIIAGKMAREEYYRLLKERGVMSRPKQPEAEGHK